MKDEPEAVQTKGKLTKEWNGSVRMEESSANAEFRRESRLYQGGSVWLERTCPFTRVEDEQAGRPRAGI